MIGLLHVFILNFEHRNFEVVLVYLLRIIFYQLFTVNFDYSNPTTQFFDVGQVDDVFEVLLENYLLIEHRMKMDQSLI